jgi:GNAT superfamily N-acetyltransferase
LTTERGLPGSESHLSNVTIERARTGDCETILDLMEQFYSGESYPFERARARNALVPLLADPAKGVVFLLRERGGAIGYAVLTLGWSLEYQGLDAFVDELYVVASHRGRGLGSRALDAVEKSCRELGVHALHLEVERDNRAARDLYEKRDYRDNDRLLMTKRLTPPVVSPDL